MGIDVLLYAETTPTEQELEAAEESFFERSSIADRYEKDGEVKWLSLAFEEETDWSSPRVRVNTMSRYYGPGYERGDWPGIYGAIRLLQSLFPHARVFYGGDTDDVAAEVTEESLAETWRHFLGPEGNAYRERSRALSSTPTEATR